jgi:multiple sugar transport system permease protein
VLSPYIWMVSASLKPLDEIFRSSLSLIPQRFGGDANYGRVFDRVPVLTYLFNGIVVCGGILFFQLLFAVPRRLRAGEAALPRS